MDWRLWSGYYVAANYNEFHHPEYAAIRNASALIDVSPLFKYEVRGRDAQRLVDRVFTRDFSKIEPGQAVYTPWCDDAGHLVQEGTVFRLEDERFQVNAAEPALAWLHRNSVGLRAEIEDVSTRIAALSLQGPTSRSILAAVTDGEPDVAALRFFRILHTRIGSTPVMISRTGYTGDLGYEIWLEADSALRVWDVLMGGGKDYGLTPCGLMSMDTARIEAGFMLIGVDYVGAEYALIDADKSSPYELGLGWSIKLDKGPFVGRQALARERQAGSAWSFVGLEIEWAPLQTMYARDGLMPDLPLEPCREPVPIYSGGRQVGRATTRVWSTLLKKYLALATVETPFAAPGTPLEMEVTVHYERERAPAQVAALPFFRPERMRA